VVETGEDLLDRDPQFKHRNTFVQLDHPDGGEYRTQAGPHFLLSKTRFDVRRAPRLGEHNEYVFKEILGIPGEEYEKLVKEGVID